MIQVNKSAKSARCNVGLKPDAQITKSLRDSTQAVPQESRNFRPTLQNRTRLFALFALIVLALAINPSGGRVSADQPTWTPTDVPTITPTSLNELALPAPLCTLQTGRLICYHELHHAAPIPITPIGQPIGDFALSPEGDWVAYRTGSTLLMASTVNPAGQGAPRAIDPNAAFPDFSGSSGDTIAWAPDSLTIVYITAFGFRAIDSHSQMVDVIDRPYVALRWSPDGSSLAAQTAIGGWHFFAYSGNPPRFQHTRTVSEPADAAWISPTSAVIAPRSGGLYQIDITTPDSAPAWSIPTEHFITLHSGKPLQVLAIHTEAGNSTGNAVAITISGQWAPFGQAALDLQMQWGPPLSDQLVYITSGTPILTDRATGDENMLPFQQVARLIWSPSALPEVNALPMDADVYFVAPDLADVPQVWRLSRSGAPLQQITYSAAAITAYDVGSAALQYFTADGASHVTNLSGATPTPTATITLTPTLSKIRPRATITPAPTLTPTAFSSVTPASSANSYTLRTVGWQPGPALFVRVSANGTISPPVLIGSPVLSPGGTFSFGVRGSQLIVLNWITGQEVAIAGIHDPTLMRWMG